MLISTGLIVVMAVFIKVCAVHTPSSNPRKSKARKLTMTLRRSHNRHRGGHGAQTAALTSHQHRSGRSGGGGGSRGGQGSSQGSEVLEPSRSGGGGGGGGQGQKPSGGAAASSGAGASGSSGGAAAVIVEKFRVGWVGCSLPCLLGLLSSAFFCPAFFLCLCVSVSCVCV